MPGPAPSPTAPSPAACAHAPTPCTRVTKAVLEGAPAGAIFALLDCNELTEEKWREVFVERCPATDSVPAHFKLLSGDTR